MGTATAMPSKRRNNGRNKHGRGMTAMLRCSNCGRSVPEDKAIKRFQVRNIVDASSQRDIRDASLYQTYALPKLFIKTTITKATLKAIKAEKRTKGKAAQSATAKKNV